MSGIGQQQKLSSARWTEANAILKLSWKLAVANAMKISVDIVSIIFIGHLGKLYMSSAALANVTSNVTGNSILFGLADALSTLSSQAFGAGHLVAMNETLQRAFLILTCVCVPIAASWVFSAEAMVMLGQSPDVAVNAALYLQCLVPALFARAYYMLLQGWLVAQQETTAPLVVSVAAAALHPLWCYLLIYPCGLQFLGAALALSLTRVLETALLGAYVIYNGYLEKTSFRLSRRAFRGWSSYLKLGLPNILMLSQWWAEEIIVFFSGLLSDPETQIAAMSIFLYLVMVCWQLVKSISSVAAARVGFFLGADQPERAALVTYTALGMSVSIAAAQVVAVLLFREDIAYVFTSDERVAGIVSQSLLFILAFYALADGVQGTLAGVLNGMGRQQLAGPVVFVCYYLVGIPAAALLSGVFGVGLHLQVEGLCLGITAATWLHAALYSGIVHRTSWAERAGCAQQRLTAEPILEDGDGVRMSVLTSADTGEGGISSSSSVSSRSRLDVLRRGGTAGGPAWVAVRTGEPWADAEGEDGGTSCGLPEGCDAAV